MIDEISVLRFKAIEKLTLPLERINLLIGANNSGKSSVLQAIQFAISAAQTMKHLNAEWRKGEMRLSFGSDQLVYSPLREIASLRHNRLFAESYLGFEVSFTKKNNSASNAAIPTQTTTISVDKGRGQNIACRMTGPELGKLFTPLSQPFSVFVPGLAGIPISEELKSEVLVRRAAARGDSNSVFRNILWLLHQNQPQWTKFMADFRKVFPDLAISVSFKIDRDEYINCVLFKSYMSLPIDAAGTGVLQAIQILAYVHLYRPKLLILDEPDAHLHPNNQRRLIRLICNLAAESNFQVILSSHSRHMLDELDDTSRKHWIRNGARVDDTEYDGIAALFDLGALDRGDQLRAGKVKGIIFTEDEDTLPLRQLLKASDLNLEEIEIWPYKGCSNVDTALALTRFILKHAAKVHVLVHRDRDYHTDEEIKEYRESIEGSCPNVAVFITDGTDTESYFLNVDHICTILPKLKKEQAETFIQRATDDVAEESLKCYINSRQQIDSRRCKREGIQVNLGDLSVNCTKDFSKRGTQLRHGKKVLKRLRHLFQTELKISQIPFQSSIHLRVEALAKFSAKLKES